MSSKPVLQPQLVTQSHATTRLSYLQRAVLRRGHPRYIIVAIVGGIWTLHFLWLHNVVWAIAALLISAILGRATASTTDVRALAKTTWGRMMLLHLATPNVVTQSIGATLLVFAVWIHSPELIMAATSLILIGHMWGWHDVNDAL